MYSCSECLNNLVNFSSSVTHTYTWLTTSFFFELNNTFITINKSRAFSASMLETVIFYIICTCHYELKGFRMLLFAPYVLNNFCVSLGSGS